MIYLFGLFITCFLIPLLLLKKDKKTADFVLMTWICVLALHLFIFYLHFSGLSFHYPQTLGLHFSLPLLHGVLLYVYVKELTQNSILKLRQIILHLIPFVALTALAIPFYSLPADQKIEVFKHAGQGFEWYSMIQLSLILLSGFGYSVATIVTIYKHRKKVYHTFSNSDQKMLRWLEYLTIGLGIIWIIAGFFDDTIIFGFVTLFVLFIGFFGINQIPVFYSASDTEMHLPPVVANPSLPVINTATSIVSDNISIASITPEVISESASQEKYAKTGLKDTEASHLMEQLEEIMQTEKPFRNCELTLNDLAQLLQVPSHQLSQVINSRSDKTFYHYINTYRINEFLRVAALPENRKYTFLALAFDCGFNSKTTFNKYFKLQTGKTPSEYFEASQIAAE